ncbi:MAG TPA: glycosyltransferase family 39 protein [Myxococcota bacterium]|nr:glycosyltransferase family 39 protein [Myxococcota bacterium]
MGARVSELRRPAAWSRSELAATALIAALALALRVAHLLEIRSRDPYLALPAGTASAYEQWAIEIARGSGFGEGASALAPLYAYFLGALYWAFSGSALVAAIAQAAIGALNPVLVIAVGRRLFDRRVALLAGAICAVYSTLLFYGAVLSPANLAVPCALLLALAAARAQQLPTPLRWLALGAALGLCALAGEALLLLAPLIATWPLLLGEPSLARARAWRAVAIIGVGMSASILPVALRNGIAADGLALIDANAGVAFYEANQHNASGNYGMPRRYPRAVADAHVDPRRLFGAVAEQAARHELASDAVSAFWAREGALSIAAEPWRWLRLELRKLGTFWNAAEPWLDRSPSAERELSRVRRLPLPGFGLVAPLALLGLVLAAREWRRLYALYAILAAQLASALVFSVSAEQRLVAVPALMLFAAFASCWLWDRARAKRGRALGIGAAALAAAAAFVHLPIARDNYARAYHELGLRFAELERWDQAIEYFGRSLNRDPGAVSAWSHLALAFEARGGRQRDAVHSWLRVLDLARREEFALHAERAERHLRALGFEPQDAPPGLH